MHHISLYKVATRCDSIVIVRTVQWLRCKLPVHITNIFLYELTVSMSIPDSLKMIPQLVWHESPKMPLKETGNWICTNKSSNEVSSMSTCATYLTNSSIFFSIQYILIFSCVACLVVVSSEAMTSHLSE